MKYIIAILCAFGCITVFGLIISVFQDIETSSFFDMLAPTVGFIGAAIGYSNCKK